MIGLIIICSLVGAVILILICGSFTAISPNVSEPIVPSFPESAYTFDAPAERRFGTDDMIKDGFREDIIRHSVEILRSMGWSEEKIREEMLRDFSVEENLLDEIIENGT
ncbi:MAG: hypothetical protein NC124_18790 [Clostridium sp.]|nr:hypothetical protein [Clostridium sp.]